MNVNDGIKELKEKIAENNPLEKADELRMLSQKKANELKNINLINKVKINFKNKKFIRYAYLAFIILSILYIFTTYNP
jgi:hypothetical protein